MGNHHLGDVFKTFSKHLKQIQEKVPMNLRDQTEMAGVIFERLP